MGIRAPSILGMWIRRSQIKVRFQNEMQMPFWCNFNFRCLMKVELVNGKDLYDYSVAFFLLACVYNCWGYVLLDIKVPILLVFIPSTSPTKFETIGTGTSPRESLEKAKPQKRPVVIVQPRATMPMCQPCIWDTWAQKKTYTISPAQSYRRTSTMKKSHSVLFLSVTDQAFSPSRQTIRRDWFWFLIPCPSRRPFSAHHTSQEESMQRNDYQQRDQGRPRIRSNIQGSLCWPWTREL